MARPSLIRSFAKINLFLDVICKRSDGYHNIETVLQTIDLNDELTLELLPSGFEIHCDNKDIPSDSRNLAAKAFLVFQQALSYKGGIRIIIKKTIPAGAGLGGGSSNAAAVLRGLNDLLHAGLTEEELFRIARPLGADVPFFLKGGMAAAWGIGERLMPLPPIKDNVLLVAVPSGVSVSTSLAYSKIDAPECSTPPPGNLSECGTRFNHFIGLIEPSLSFSLNTSLIQNLYNRLEAPVFKLFPQVAELKDAMIHSGATAALMSGSGSSIFGMVEEHEHAKYVRRRLEAGFPCQCLIAATNHSGSYLDM